MDDDLQGAFRKDVTAGSDGMNSISDPSMNDIDAFRASEGSSTVSITSLPEPRRSNVTLQMPKTTLHSAL